jgi:hypothetical protein
MKKGEITAEDLKIRFQENRIFDHLRNIQIILMNINTHRIFEAEGLNGLEKLAGDLRSILEDLEKYK